MTRLISWLILSGLLGLSIASPQKLTQEEQNRNADCDNGCFFGSFPGGSCTNDAACMRTQQKYRERYFCCMAEKCAPSVLPDSVQRQTLECEARNMEFTFDVEKVCGITLTTTSSAASSISTPSVASTAARDSDDSSATFTLDTTASTPDATANAPSTSTFESTSAGSAVPATNDGLQTKATLNVVAIVVLGMVLV